MRPILWIRKHIFRITQAQMGAITRTTQATVSRWETGVFEPQRRHLKLIRAYAKRRKIPWEDAYFFDGPKTKKRPAPRPEPDPEPDPEPVEVPEDLPPAAVELEGAAAQ